MSDLPATLTEWSHPLRPVRSQGYQVTPKSRQPQPPLALCVASSALKGLCRNRRVYSYCAARIIPCWVIVEDLSVTPLCESRWEVGHGCISNQITQVINSTASGPYGTCQLYAIVAYLTITSNTSSTRLEGPHHCAKLLQ